MFTLQDVREVDLERIVNYINEKNKKLKISYENE